MTLPSATSSVTGVDDSVSGIGSVSKPATKSKTELWNDIKIESLTRALVLIYSSALLVFFTRLQLNILGRINYVSSVAHMTEARPKDVIEMDGDDAGIVLSAEEELSRAAREEEEATINRMYLTFSWWLLNKGWVSLSERIHDAVASVFDEVTPRTDVTLEDLSQLIGRVQFKIDHPVTVLESNNFFNNLLPPPELDSYVLSQRPVTEEGEVQNTDVTPPLRRLLDETADFIESPNAVDVIQRLVHAGLTTFVNKLSPLFPASQGDPSKAKLASVLATVTKQAHFMASGQPYEPNEYISSMVNVPELDGFSALVYSNFNVSEYDSAPYN
jgi:peroxin-3